MSKLVDEDLGLKLSFPLPSCAPVMSLGMRLSGFECPLYAQRTQNLSLS